MGDIGWALAARVSARWRALPERVRDAVWAALLLACFALVGAVDASAPSGMYY